MTYSCDNCAAPMNHSIDREKVERYIGPKQEPVTVYVRGLGTWHCRKCGGQKVRRGK